MSDSGKIKNRLTLGMLSGLVWLGFVLHTSSGDSLLLGKYSPAYGIFLVILSVVWLFILWWAWKQGDKLGRLLRIAALNILFTVLILALVLPPVFIGLHQNSLKKNLLAPPGPDAHSFFQIDRAPELPVQESPHVIRVLALGGSTTYGSRLEREQAYPAVLGQMLEHRYPQAQFEIFNAGVPWHTSMHSLLRYVALYSDWEPDIVIVMHAFNDIFQASEGKLASGGFRGDYGHFFGALGLRVNPRDQFTDDVRRLLVNNWLSRTWYSDVFQREPAPERKPVDLLRALPSFSRNLCQLVRRANDDGADVVLLTQPSLYREEMSQEEIGKLFYDYYYRDYAVVPAIHEQSRAMENFNRTTRDVANSCGAMLVDLEQHIPRKTEYMYDDVHYTVSGANLVASKLLDLVPWADHVLPEGTREQQ